jgi:hypothetical protein
MFGENKDLENLVETQLVRVSARFFAIVAGVLGGLGLFVATNWLVLKGGPIGPEGERLIGPHLSLLGQYFIGYRVSFAGSLIGFAWAFASCGAVAYAGARLYNCVAHLRHDKRSAGG